SGAFDIVNYLFGAYCPFWPGSFFRRQALLDVGLDEDNWVVEALEFEIWCRLGTRHTVKSFPDLMSKHAIHDGQLSNTPKAFNEHLDGRAAVIERLFAAD